MRQQKKHDVDYDVAQFESHPRRSQWERDGEEDKEKVHYLLPLKSKQGLIQQPAVYKSPGM